MRPLITDDTTEPLLAQLHQTHWGGWFFSTQSWVGQENSFDEPQMLLLCSKLPTDPLGLPSPTNTSPTTSLQGVLPFLSPTLVGHGQQLCPGSRESWHWAKWSHQKPKALLTVPHKYFLQEIALGCFGTALLCKKNWTLLGFQKRKFKWCHNTF